MNTPAKFLIVAGIFLLFLGFLFLLLEKCAIPLGRLPGDFIFRRKNVIVAFPFMTMLIVSVVLTVSINLLHRWFR